MGGYTLRVQVPKNQVIRILAVVVVGGTQLGDPAFGVSSSFSNICAQLVKLQGWCAGETRCRHSNSDSNNNNHSNSNSNSSSNSSNNGNSNIVVIAIMRSRPLQKPPAHALDCLTTLSRLGTGEGLR